MGNGQSETSGSSTLATVRDFFRYTLFTSPWRDIKWTEKDKVLWEVKDYNLPNADQLIRVLVYGPVGAGKSSFINSVQSAVRGRIYRQALVENNAAKSYTRQYTTYKIPRGINGFYPFAFADTMGMERTQGIQINDIKQALMGQIPEGYKFNADSLEGDVRITQNDNVHVLLCVYPSDNMDELDKHVAKIKEIRAEAAKLGIPQAAVLTKVDMACPEVRRNLRNIYKVSYMKDKMEKFSKEVGIPMNCIFPVKNYHEETELENDMDVLILSALKNIINMGEDYIRFKMES